jgi:MFS family permease
VKRLLLLVGAIVFFDTVFYAALTPLLPHYAEELGLSKTSAGVLSGSYAFGGVIGVFPAAALSARLGVKTVTLVGLVGMIVTTTFFGFAHSELLLDATRFFQGVASVFTWTAALAWLVAEAPAESRGRLIGSAMGVAIFGAMFGPVIGGIASVTSTEATFGGIAAISCLLAVWAAMTRSDREPTGQPLSFLFRAFRSRRMVASSWLVALPSVSFGVLGVLGPLRLHDLGLGTIAIGAVWLTAIGFEATGPPLIGHLSDTRGRLLPLRAGAAAACVCFGAFTFLDGHWPTYAVAIVVVSFALGAFWAPSMSMASDEAEALGLDHAFGFAIINLSWAPAQIAGSAGGGALADATSDTVPYLVLAALFALTLAALWRFRSSS